MGSVLEISDAASVGWTSALTSMLMQKVLGKIWWLQVLSRLLYVSSKYSVLKAHQSFFNLVFSSEHYISDHMCFKLQQCLISAVIPPLACNQFASSSWVGSVSHFHVCKVVNVGKVGKLWYERLNGFLGATVCLSLSIENCIWE